MTRTDDTNRFYKLKSDKLKLPWDEQPHRGIFKHLRDYIDDSGEMATHMKQFGEELGIPEGFEYPGYAVFKGFCTNASDVFCGLL